MDGKKLLRGFVGKGSFGLMGDPQAFIREESPVRILPLEEMVRNLLVLDKEVWILYGWSTEPLAGKFSREQKLEYGKKAALCGRQEAEAAREKLTADETVTVDFTALSDLAGRLGVKLDMPQIPNGGSHIIFAQYQEPDSVTIFMDSVQKAEELIKSCNLEPMLWRADVKALLLAHELFHVTEYRKRDSIYTQTERVELWRKPFSNRSRLICLGEIAGMEYARHLLGLKYSPCIFDVIMMYGYDKEAATALYEEIMELARKRGGEEQ